MFIKKINLKITALFCLLALVASSEIFAGQKSHRGNRTFVQANYQDGNALIPVSDQPIPFSVKNFRNNIEVNGSRTVFEVEVPGLYSLDSFLVINIPNIGDSVDGYITINGRKLLTFYSRETRTTANPLVNFHFNDRLVYLDKGDQVSVVLSTFVPGTFVLSRGFVMITLK